MFFCKQKKQYFKRYKNYLQCGNIKIPIQKINNFSVPIFQKQKKNKNEFSKKNAVKLHANAMNWLLSTHNTNEDKLRKKIISSIPKKENLNKILVTSCGEGRDLPYLAKAFPKSIFYIQDIAIEMLEHAIRQKIKNLKISQLNFWSGDACDLPFSDESFDLVYHFGGFNLFDKPHIGVKEMQRVLKNGGACIFGDEGMAPFMYNSEISKALYKNNPLYKSEPPLKLLSPNISNFKLEFILNNCFYLVSFIKKQKLELNLNIKHEGIRGGSIYTRYFGQLEGIDPVLRDKIYKLAEVKGLSRVQLLETIIKNRLEIEKF